MRNPDQPYTTNLLLAALGPDDLALVRPHLTRERLHRDRTLIARDRPIEHIWFPEGGVASVIAETADHGRTEVGIFGREGFAGTTLLLGADSSPHEVFVQVDHHTALRMDAAGFLAAVDESATLRTLLLRYVQTFIVQIAQSATSNARQRIEARLARWLLMCHDWGDGDEIELTHEFMAMMIAAERSGVTVALHACAGRRGDDPLEARAGHHSRSRKAGGARGRRLWTAGGRVSPPDRAVRQGWAQIAPPL